MIILKLDVKPVLKVHGGYKRTLPAGMRRGAWLSTQRMQKAIRQEIRKKKLIWRGKLLKKTQARKISKNIFGIAMPYYGPYLDSMRTHWVALKRGRLITRWAEDRRKEKGLFLKSEGQSASKAIRVKKHPFIDKPVTKVERKTKRIVEKEINKAIRKKGR